MYYFNLLDLRPQLLQGAVAVYPIRDIISKAVAQHSFAVCFPDTVTLTQPAEGMPAGVRAFFFYAQAPQRCLHIPPKLRDTLPRKPDRSAIHHHALHQRPDRAVDWYNSVPPRLGLDAALEIPLLQIGLKIRLHIGTDAEAGIAHGASPTLQPCLL